MTRRFTNGVASHGPTDHSFHAREARVSEELDPGVILRVPPGGRLQAVVGHHADALPPELVHHSLQLGTTSGISHGDPIPGQLCR